jgi:hypothetical protein
MRMLLSGLATLTLVAAATTPAPAQVPPAVPIAALAVGIVGLATGVSNLVLKVAGDENAKREAFTKGFVEQAAQQYPGYNVVLVHTAHATSGEYVHQHHELPMDPAGVRTIGYEIYFAKKGRPFSLELRGDGGFINWAYLGEFNRNGQTIRAIEHG